ncbi:hypothetical protein AYJ54_24205 [Bradyrhizobium centrolobii]|uniref:Uncharacterized protein n=2 Tax=Bradyrhizobium TaxID=374 RepID=A0A176Z0I4_9BRAD|nr:MULTISPECIES: hypothetical protein [Bradyrhizobium]OAF04295.1 hypothetical protein AYJ54_24205 [Bradyrhizobium centrolobii]OAF12527.1 hypothetical protein AXW67_20190 [Bradyrhizobium neotropicale]
MKTSFLAVVLCSALALLGLRGGALADTVRRYDCSIDGVDREPLGDRDEHFIISLQYTCHVAEGPLRDAGITAISVSELNGEKGTSIASLDIHRAIDGFAVGQLLEGVAFLVMRDKRSLGIAASGKMVFKFASGSLSALSGRTVNFTTKPAGFGRFEMEFSDWPEAAQPK